MKNSLILSVIALCLCVSASPEQRAAVPQALKSKVTECRRVADENANPLNFVPNRYTAAIGFPEEEIGYTVYDLQSNSCSPYGRLCRYDDGTFNAVWTRGTGPTAYNDRGTGYNYFDGTSWGEIPAARLESQRTGWPSVAKLGPAGEAVISHRGAAGLMFLKRAVKGTGTWTEATLPPPTGASGLFWARMITSGPDHNTVHLLAVTTPVANGGVKYEGLDGALLYYRSTDGGETWDQNGVILPGLTSNKYYGFSGDFYTFAEPKGDNIAFVVTDPQNDMFLMKSTDNGETWNKTIIWEHPYPHLANGVVTDTLWGCDGAASLAYDNSGKLYLAFAVYRLIFTATGYTFWPGLSGITYWTEDMPVYTGGDQFHALHVDSLDAHGLLIGYYNIDWNGNGTLDIIDAGGYNNGWASWPQLSFDDNNNAILIYSALMENYSNTAQNYRHILCRASSNGARDWGPVFDLTDDEIHMFDECCWPVISDESDELNWYFTYQLDTEPGTALGQDEDIPGDNYFNFYLLSKIVNKIEEAPANLTDISSNYPNPFSDRTTVNVTLGKPTPVSVKVSNVAGRQVEFHDYGILGAGVHTLTIGASKLAPGVYMYTVYAGQQTATKKMIVK